MEQNTQFTFQFHVKIDVVVFDRDKELYLPDHLKNETNAENYYHYAQNLRDELKKVKIVMHDPIHLKPVVGVKLFLFSPKKNGNDIIDHHIELIVDHESRLFTFESIEDPIKEVRDTIVKIKQFIYDMEIIRLQQP